MDFKRNDRVIYSGDKYIIIDILYDIEICTIVPRIISYNINGNTINNKVLNAVDLQLDRKYYREEKLKLLLDGI